MASPVPPSVEKRPHELSIHGDRRIDDYYWLRERENPEVIHYLEEENTYTQAMMAPTEELQEKLVEEIRGRIQQDDQTAPYLKGGYWYYRRTEEGRQYPIYCRRSAADPAGDFENAGVEQILLDVNELSDGEGYLSVSGVTVSPDHTLMVYGVDDVGRRRYSLRVKNLETGEHLADQIDDVTANVVWANDNRTLFYSRQDPDTLRTYQTFRHTLVGEDGTKTPDVLVYEEPDETFSTWLRKTRSEQYLLITSSQTLRTEVRYLDADQPEGDFQLFEPRAGKREYYVDHLGDFFYLRTNDDAKNFRVMKTPVTATARSNWHEVVPHRSDALLEGFLLFEDFLVVDQRVGGLNEFSLLSWHGNRESTRIDFGEPAYSVSFGANPSVESTTLRYRYTSLTTPPQDVDYDMASGEVKIVKQTQVLGGFDRSDYLSERLQIEARDGQTVPVSVVSRKGTPRDGSSPLLLYAYGSYGSSMDASFNASLISLLDRGFIYAIAHIRGGQELGFDWYEGGKLLNKKNTFTDFVDVADGLIARGYTNSDRLIARGGSAGGLLMGAVVNMRPELWKAVVAHVPFVDVITTMLDETIPLTTFEWDEWGNPKDEQYYRYMLSYSPYDQVEAKDYPAMLVTTGLHDSQVQYWEPAKWVAKLREMKTDDSVLLLKTNMEAGHGGASGRYERYRETAFEYAFMLDMVKGL